ncbi:beta-alanyl-dopamine/carcinine hydrolase [Euwallacea fornicatus]|uniref:beta-alanyl-dopamine/carcinine hydrolase n=1 Tax=Euwallacea fornicatus TaxID=995702 RepID=UPI00338F2FE2
MQPTEPKLSRRNCIPIIYTRGTHYEVGFDVGRTFSGLIHSFLEQAESLPKFLEAYSSPAGKNSYHETLENLKIDFPQYVKELEGIADGAKVSFHKLFLLHMDDIILAAAQKKPTSDLPTGCSTICVNHEDQELLGHTEDALAATLNHYYFVSAHIISDQPQGKWGVQEEKFTSLCYAGHLPGYTMNYNHHGLVFSVNTLCAKRLKPGKTPRHFIARALLATRNFSESLEIMQNSGGGAGDGCSFNVTFLKEPGKFYNIEMAPTLTDQGDESELDVMLIDSGNYSYHANSYLHLKSEETNKHMIDSSVARLEAFNTYPIPKTEEDLRKMLSDQSHLIHPVFRDQHSQYVKTICVGIFNIKKKTWSLYADNPKENKPLVVLPIEVQ